MGCMGGHADDIGRDAGHGSQAKDNTGVEADGYNETLCPTDFQSAGMIIDDEVNQMLINPLPQGVRNCSNAFIPCHSFTPVVEAILCSFSHALSFHIEVYLCSASRALAHSSIMRHYCIL